MNWFPLWLACGLLTFAIRYSFIALEGHYRPPGWFVRWLPFVPIAALTAISAPELLLTAGQLDIVANPKFWAGMIAIAVAARWRNTLLTIVVGFIALVILRTLL
jgi:branched-subunit amino acid transport protein